MIDPAKIDWTLSFLKGSRVGKEMRLTRPNGSHFSGGICETLLCVIVISIPFFKALRVHSDTWLDPVEKRPGRHPVFTFARKRVMHRTHIYITTDLLKAIQDYSIVIDEPSLSRVVRILLRERLRELGYLKESS